MEPVFRSYLNVELVEGNASDDHIVRAARVSTGSTSTAGSPQLIDFLVRNRHGSPFEHTFFTWRVEAPIFVWREHMRHRIGFSYNEESGRYKQLEPIFYVPPPNRALVQEGKSGEYTYVEGSQVQVWAVREAIEENSRHSYSSYVDLLEAGVAREVARMVLPVNIFSSAYVSMNARSLMNFLSLRTMSPDSTFPSYPMAEISWVADAYEDDFARLMPHTHEAFVRNGRVAP